MAEKTAHKTQAEMLAQIEDELADYAAFRTRIYGGHYDFRDALLAHRDQCLSNLLASEDSAWADRVRLIDAIADAKGIWLGDDARLADALDEIGRRDSKRDEDEAARKQGVTVQGPWG
ncbi:MAG: hypothetical protein ACREI2_14825 [Nitrospiraceae bacterium]